MNLYRRKNFLTYAKFSQQPLMHLNNLTKLGSIFYIILDIFVRYIKNSRLIWNIFHVREKITFFYLCRQRRAYYA